MAITTSEPGATLKGLVRCVTHSTPFSACERLLHGCTSVLVKGSERWVNQENLASRRNLISWVFSYDKDWLNHWRRGLRNNELTTYVCISSTQCVVWHKVRDRATFRISRFQEWAYWRGKCHFDKIILSNCHFCYWRLQYVFVWCLLAAEARAK